jgi:hypothetical protein
MTSRLSYDRRPEKLDARHAGRTDAALLCGKWAHRAAVAVLGEGTGDDFELEIGEYDDPSAPGSASFAPASDGLRAVSPLGDRRPRGRGSPSACGLMSA